MNTETTITDLKELGTATGQPPTAPEADSRTPAEPVIDAQGRSYATGRRKNAVARVWIKPGSGRILVNNREFSYNFV